MIQTYGQFRTSFLTRLNRSDATDALADSFITEGTSRIQRELRAPFMERVFEITPTVDAVSGFVVPQDYIETIDLIVDGTPLDRLTYRQFLRMRSSCPRYYARYEGTIYVVGDIPVGSTAEFLYYGAFTGIVDDADSNELLAAAPDLLMYAALSTAGDHFSHEKTAEWDARYVMTRDAVQMQANEDELRGSPQAISPLYTDPGV